MWDESCGEWLGYCHHQNRGSVMIMGQGFGRLAAVGGGRDRGGFTLPELMVVIAIIALLIALLLPTLQRAREMTRMARCMTEMRGDGMLKTQIGVDTRYFLPVAEKPANAMAKFGRTFFVTKTDPASSYVWYAVMDQWAGYDPKPTFKQRRSVCPSFNNSHLKPTNMGYTACYAWTMNAPHIDYGYAPNYRLKPLRYERIRPAALIATECHPHPNPNDANYYFYGFNNPYLGYQLMNYRHQGKANYLAHDGSVSTYMAANVPVDRFKLGY